MRRIRPVGKRKKFALLQRRRPGGPPPPRMVSGIVQGEHDWMNDLEMRRQLLAARPPSMLGKLGRLAGAIARSRRTRP